MAARPAWGDYLALGERVIFVAEGTAYEVVEGAGKAAELPLVQATATPFSPVDLPTPATPSVAPTPTPRGVSGGGPCAGALRLRLCSRMALSPQMLKF